LIDEQFLDGIVSALARRERVELRKFDSFSVKVFDSRVGRNPKTGTKLQVPETVLPRYRTSIEMRRRLNFVEEASEKTSTV
jgi:integration host factor subunit beta